MVSGKRERSRRELEVSGQGSVALDFRSRISARSVETRKTAASLDKTSALVLQSSKP